MRSERAVMAMLLLAVGCDRNGANRNENYNPDTHGRPAAGYTAPRSGCPPTDTVPLPTLPMPWGRPQELYLASARAVAGFAIDYAVVPSAIVDELRVEFDYGSPVQPSPTVIAGECPSAVQAASWAVPGTVDDVVLVRVVADSRDAGDRMAWLSYPSGAHSYALDLSAISPANRAGSFFVVYQPTWGEPRIALVPVSLPADGDVVTVTGLPSGVAHIALIRSHHVRALDGSSALAPFPGFASLWPAASSDWYGALVPANQRALVRLRAYRTTADRAAYGPLRDDLPTPLPPDTDLRLVSFGPGATDGDVELACDGLTTLDVPFRAKVRVSIGDNLSDLTSGARAVLNPACDSGSVSRRASIHVESETSDGWLVFREP